MDAFYGRTMWGVTAAALGYFGAHPRTLITGTYDDLWVPTMGTKRLYGKLHNLTRRNILKPHPPKPCLPKFCTRAVKEGPLVGGDEILARMNWEPVFFISKIQQVLFLGVLFTQESRASLDRPTKPQEHFGIFVFGTKKT